MIRLRIILLRHLIGIATFQRKSASGRLACQTLKLSHVIVFSERHLRHLLLSYTKYCNGPARIYPWRKMHRSRAPSIAPGTFFVAQPWADCITNMPGFDLRQAQVAHRFMVALKSDLERTS